MVAAVAFKDVCFRPVFGVGEMMPSGGWMVVKFIQCDGQDEGRRSAYSPLFLSDTCRRPLLA